MVEREEFRSSLNVTANATLVRSIFEGKSKKVSLADFQVLEVPGGLGVARGGASAPPATLPDTRDTMLDTSTPKHAQTSYEDSRRRRTMTKRTRKLYSRVLLGLMIPGTYYFLTFTLTPESPRLEEVWRGLSQWLHRQRPGACWCYCFTDEGPRGVLHMVIRLGKGEKRLDAKTVRAYWERATGARQINLKWVRQCDRHNLAEYLSNQKKKRGLGKEMGYQDAVYRWRWSDGWLPAGFTKHFGRFWVRWMEAPEYLRDSVLSCWITKCALNPDQDPSLSCPGDWIDYDFG